MENYIRNKHERVDNLHVENYKIIQNAKYFCYGIDAVLLSYYANNKIPMQSKVKIMDLGTGTGIIPILLYAMDSNRIIHGIEIQEYFVDMAYRSLLLNKLNDKIIIHQGDIKNLPDNISKNSFDVVVANPPYVQGGNGLLSDNPIKAIARHEVMCSLADIIDASKRLLKDNGKLIMIHKAYRLVDIIHLMRINSIEPKSISFIHSKINQSPTLVLIEGLKNGNPQLNYDPPIIIYKEDGTYTEQIKEIYYSDSQGES